MENLDALWVLASQGERYEIASRLIDKAFIDLESGLVGAIVPQPELGRLMDHALSMRPESGVTLVRSADFGVDPGEGVGVVDLRGVEPLTSTLPVWRSTS